MQHSSTAKKMPKQSSSQPKQKSNISWPLIVVGLVGLLVGLGVLGFSYGPLITAEVQYFITSQNYDEDTFVVANPNSSSGATPSAEVLEELADTTKNVIVPVDTDFGIVIPRIQANAPIVENVDPYNSEEYQQQLSLGIAHASGTSLPEQSGNMFLFAHSSGDVLMARRYNAVFYLLHKLQRGDAVYVFKDDVRYKYTVTTKEVVSGDAVEYLQSDGVDDHTLTLMTCTPAGTTQNRLLVHAVKSKL